MSSDGTKEGYYMKKTRTIFWIITTALLSLPCIASAQIFTCNNNPDYFTKRCTIHPNAITKVVKGMVVKGHLVGCQFKSYSCLGTQCQDNFGTAVVPFDFPMTDLNSFCSLLCKAPACTELWR
jgi:hypothetical protein